MGKINSISIIDKEAHRASAYEVIRIAKQNSLKVVIKTKGSN